MSQVLQTGSVQVRPGRSHHPAAQFAANRVTLVCMAVIAALAFVAIFAPQIAPYDPVAQSLLSANLDPSPEHWLGTDQFGRDILSRIIFGSRASLLLGLVAPLVAGVCGSLLGITAGYFGGIVDRLIGRVTDLLLAFPALLIGIMVAAALGPGFWELVTALAVSFAPRFARIARASTQSVCAEPFVEAAVASGLTHKRILLRHILPNIAGPIVVVLTLWIATAIRLEATLSFLGLGTQAPKPSWGNIIRDGLDNLFGSPWPIVSAGAAITVTALAFSLIGDAVRDALDPELRD
jgi:peptide/nickel transport system permease protein